MRKRQSKVTVKRMTYQIKQDVLDAITDLMEREPSLNTMHKVIDYCIVHHVPLRKALAKTEDKLISLQNSKHSIETELTKLVQFNEFLKKYTKTS